MENATLPAPGLGVPDEEELESPPECYSTGGNASNSSDVVRDGR
jgi:hypothetical protein